MIKSNKNKLLNLVEDSTKSIITRLEKMEKFTLEQAPEVCKEIYNKRCFETLMNCVIFLGLTIFLAIITTVLISIAVHNHTTGDGGESAVTIFCSLVSIITSIAFLISFVSAIQYSVDYKICKMAPKLTILKELKRLIK